MKKYWKKKRYTGYDEQKAIVLHGLRSLHGERIIMF